MLFDWFTVVAQIVNFLVLVWLLKRYLYAPILKAIDAREELIAKRLRDADAERQAAEQQHSSWEQKNAAIEQEKSSLLQQAQTQADAERTRLIGAARTEAEQRRAQWRTTLASEAEHWRRVLLERSEQEVLAQTRQVLRDLADAGIEERIVAILLRRLQELTSRDPGQLRGLWEGSKPLTVRSAFELSDAQRTLLEQAVRAAGYPGPPLQYAQDAKLVAGIELRGDGHALSWNIADYLESLRNTVAAVEP